jgi:hypothetical protein
MRDDDQHKGAAAGADLKIKTIQSIYGAFGRDDGA